MADLLDEPFLALPASAGPLRDYWLALDERDGHPVRIAAEINDTEETYEAVASGIGICLLAAGNAPIFARGDVTMLPVADLPPLRVGPGLERAPLPATARDLRGPVRAGRDGRLHVVLGERLGRESRVNHSDRSAASVSAPRDSRSASSCALP